MPAGKGLRSAEPLPRARRPDPGRGSAPPPFTTARGEVRRGEPRSGRRAPTAPAQHTQPSPAPLRRRGEARARSGDHLPGAPFLRTRDGGGGGPGVPRVAVRAGARAVARGAAAAGGGGGSAAQARWCRGDSRARVLLCRRRRRSRSGRFSQAVPAGGGRGAARGERRSPRQRGRAAAARGQVSSERGAGRCGRTRRAPVCGGEGKAGTRRGGERWKFDSAGVCLPPRTGGRECSGCPWAGTAAAGGGGRSRGTR